MAVEFLWRLPVHGDGRRAHDRHTRGEWNASGASRLAPRHDEPDFAYIDYLSQVARAADIGGFHGALVPAFRHTEDPWMLSAALARETRRLRFLIAIQPWFIHPSYAAQMAASLQRLSHGRVEWNVITGGGGSEQRAYGDFIDHAARYERTEEFIEYVKGYTAGEPFTFSGKHYQVEEGGLKAPMNQYGVPRLWLAGASEASMRVAARHGDIHLTWAEPLEKQREVITQAQRAIEKAGFDRELGFGIRVDILARDTEEQAWAELWRMYASVTDATRNFGGRRPRDSESVGAQRQNALRAGGKRFEDLIVGRNAWAGMSEIRGGPGLVLVGSHEQVAERLAEYVDIGVSHFILASNPHLEEAYRVAEEVLPLVQGAIRGRAKIAPRLSAISA